MADIIDKEGRSPEGRALTDLILTIFRANGRLLRAGDALARDLGLTSARWQVMGALDKSSKTVAQIAREFELTRQSVLWVVQALAKDGLVELVHNPDHRRAKLVQFTARGRDIYEQMNARQKSWVNELGLAFNAAELSQATELIGRMSKKFIDETGPYQPD